MNLFKNGIRERTVYQVALSLVVIVCVVFGVLAHRCGQRNREVLRHFKACVAELKESDQKYTWISEELGKCRAERMAKSESQHDALKDSSDDLVSEMERFVERFPCQHEINMWAARVEGVAEMPSGSFKQFTEHVKNGTQSGFTRTQKLRVAQAIKKNPPPKCIEESRKKKE